MPFVQAFPNVRGRGGPGDSIKSPRCLGLPPAPFLGGRARGIRERRRDAQLPLGSRKLTCGATEREQEVLVDVVLEVLDSGLVPGVAAHPEELASAGLNPETAERGVLEPGDPGPGRPRGGLDVGEGLRKAQRLQVLQRFHGKPILGAAEQRAARL